jgi:NADH-quinone oxidoreductase subunit L
MLIPLAVLGLGAVFSGMIWYNVFFGKEEAVRHWFGLPVAEAHATAEGDHGAEGHGTAAGHATADAQAAVPGLTVPGQGAIFIHPDNTVLHDAHYVPTWVKLAPFVAMLLGLALAYQMYIRRPDWPAKLAANQRPLYLFLINKWYFDEIYDFVFVRPARWLGDALWKRGDGAVIDGGINGLALGVIPWFTRLAGRAQSGYMFHYAFAMVLGIVILVTWMTLAGGR